MKKEHINHKLKKLMSNRRVFFSWILERQNRYRGGAFQEIRNPSVSWKPLPPPFWRKEGITVWGYFFSPNNHEQKPKTKRVLNGINFFPNKEKAGDRREETVGVLTLASISWSSIRRRRTMIGEDAMEKNQMKMTHEKGPPFFGR